MLRVFSYNIHKSFSGITRKFTLDVMRDEIRRLHPDIIFLQEVHGEHLRHQKKIQKWPSLSQFEFLADQIWPHFSYGKNMIYDHGHHGNAILSKFPILSWENIDISKNKFEKRGLLHVTMKLSSHGGRTLHAICVHLGLFEDVRKKQFEEIVKRINQAVPKDDLLILAGDFNDWRGNASIPLEKELGLREAFLSQNGQYCRTFPSFLPFFRLDRIYYRGFEVARTKCLRESPWDRLSDHCALEVEFKLETEEVNK